MCACAFAFSHNAASPQVGGPWFAVEMFEGDVSDVEAGVVVAGPRPVTDVASAQPPYVPQLPILVHALAAGLVVSSLVLAVKTSH